MKELRRHTKHPVGLLPILVGLMIMATQVLEPTVSAQSPATTPSWTFTGSLHADRFGHTATLLPNGKVLVVGGGGFPCSGNFCYSTVNGSTELYDPATGTWSLTGSLIQRRVGHSATLLPNGQVLVVGGYNYGYDIGFFAYVNSAELYDPTTESWHSTASPNSAYIHNSATLLNNGKVLAVFANNPPSQGSSAELYDPATATWTSTDAPTNLGLMRPLFNGKILSVSSNASELYDPAIGKWTSTGELNVIRAVSTATILNNGKVLVTGEGESSNTFYAELYDPSSGAWSRTANPNTSAGGTATLLPNGNVLVAGAVTCSDFECHSLDSAELYDQFSGTWSLISHLKETRSDHSATLLLNGKVLLAGGQGGDIYDLPRVLTSAELYEPASSGAVNPMNDAQAFVRQQYRDFLNREPDAAGLAFWTDNITKCTDPARGPAAQTEAECIDKQRVTTSAAFFLSPEFQYTGYFVYRLYKGSLVQNGAGRFPTYLEFVRDVRQVASGIIQNDQLSAAAIEANKKTFAEEFTRRAEFRSLYDPLSNFDYVERLFQTTGVNVSAQEKQALVDGLNNQTETRASVLQKVVDGTVVIAEGNQQFTTRYGRAFYEQEFNGAFVVMEYFGYLRRDPDVSGYQHWLDKLNLYGNYIDAEMVRSFIISPEYRARFVQP